MTDDLHTRARLSLNADCLHSPGEFREIVDALVRENDALRKALAELLDALDAAESSGDVGNVLRARIVGSTVLAETEKPS